MRPIIAAMRAAAASGAPASTVPLTQMRMRAAAQFAPWNADPPALASVHDFDVPGGTGQRRARLYDPRGRTPVPLLLYLHGGGWVIGDLDMEDRALRVLALESGARIVSLDYRLAPEHPFPAALQDAVAAFGWLRAHAGELGGTADSLAIGGASAGANIALGATLDLRNRGQTLPALMVLMYGVYGTERTTESDRLFGSPELSGPLVHMQRFYDAYAGAPGQQDDPRVAPLRADLAGLPPVFLNAAGLDPLRDDSRQLRDRLQQAGVPVHYAEYPGVLHGFTQYTRTSPTARQALREAGAAIAARLAPLD